MKIAPEQIVLTATKFPHIYLCDIDDTGFLKEIAVLKKFQDGTIYYILVEGLDKVDKGRLKKIVSSVHATKYELFEIMSMSKLSNGINCLDYFHQNFVKVKRPKGAKITTTFDSIETAPTVSDKIIGSDNVDTEEAIVDKNGKGTLFGL